jgi:hypothetical protein
MRGFTVVKAIGVVARVAGGAVDVIASARRLDRRWLVRPQPLRWLGDASLDRRLAPYSAVGHELPLDAELR